MYKRQVFVITCNHPVFIILQVSSFHFNRCIRQAQRRWVIPSGTDLVAKGLGMFFSMYPLDSIASKSVHRSDSQHHKSDIPT